MKILVIGNGGREHALVWKIAQSPLATEIYAAPGNPGIFELAKEVPIPSNEVDALLKFAQLKKIDLTIVGPELPLSLGVVDRFEAQGLKIFGPSQKASQLESSKTFSKLMMEKYGVPTAAYQSFDSLETAEVYLNGSRFPLVIKADGLAAGKGVLVAKTHSEAKEFLYQIMFRKIFGNAGQKVIIEECLEGTEISILALCDGEKALLLPEARDHKRALDHDQGLNTGGMGAYSPVSEISENDRQFALEKIFCPMIQGLKQEGISYRGVLYAGLMMTSHGPKVLEFNVRFGDPETQVILPRIESDIVPLFLASCDGKLSEVQLTIAQKSALCVVLSSGGYPGSYQSGFEISGLNGDVQNKNLMIFHAGTQKKNGQYLTHGGRVLGLTALGKDITEARDCIYDAIKKIHFKNMHYRTDIGLK